MSKAKAKVTMSIKGHEVIYNIETDCGKKATLEYNVISVYVGYINSDYFKKEIFNKVFDMLGHKDFILEFYT
jgi:hypothetical protein